MWWGFLLTHSISDRMKIPLARSLVSLFLSPISSMHTVCKKTLLILGLMMVFFCVTTLATRELNVQSASDGYSMLVDGLAVDGDQNETDDNKIVIVKSVKHNFVLLSLDSLWNSFPHTLYKGPAIILPTRPPNA